MVFQISHIVILIYATGLILSVIFPSAGLTLTLIAMTSAVLSLPVWNGRFMPTLPEHIRNNLSQVQFVNLSYMFYFLVNIMTGLIVPFASKQIEIISTSIFSVLLYEGWCRTPSLDAKKN